MPQALGSIYTAANNNNNNNNNFAKKSAGAIQKLN
jgi:hypothetical protein